MPLVLADWLVRRWLSNYVHLRARETLESIISQLIFTDKVVFVAIFSTCVIYTKTIINLTVGVSGEYLNFQHFSLPPWWIIVKYKLWNRVRVRCTCAVNSAKLIKVYQLKLFFRKCDIHLKETFRLFSRVLILITELRDSHATIVHICIY